MKQPQGNPIRWLSRWAAGVAAGLAAWSASAATLPPPSYSGIDHFIIIYQENWSFDALYGRFPGANGIANASAAALP